MTNQGCLSASDLARYLDGRLDAGERGRAEEHLSRCRSCRSRLAAAYRSRAEPPVIAAPEELRRRARATAVRGAGPRRRMALAAVLIAGLGIAALVVQTRRDTAPDPEALRAPPVEAGGSEAPRLTAPDAGDEVPAGPVRFRWRPAPRARRYTLTVVDPLGNLVHRETAAEPEADVAADVFEAGREYFWYVTVVVEDGSTFESEVRSFTTRR